MKVLAIVRIELTRIFRWRANIFFLLIMPMGLILLLGVAFGNTNARVGVVAKDNGPLAKQLVAALGKQPGLDSRAYGGQGSLEKAVERGYVSAGLVIPRDYDARIQAGKSVLIRYFARPDSLAPQVRIAVESAVAAQGSNIAAARIVSECSDDLARRRAPARECRQGRAARQRRAAVRQGRQVSRVAGASSSVALALSFCSSSSSRRSPARSG